MNVTKKLKKNEGFIYIMAFLIPFLVMVIGCIKAKVYPFGDRTFLRNDMYHQYYQFFMSMYDKVKAGEGLAYSTQIGLGSNTASVYAYYLASPLSFLIFLFPRELVAEGMAFIILLKIGLSGSGLAYYLCRRFQKVDLGILFFSSAYALSGFVSAYQWNIMWLDVMIMAPLVLDALDELLEDGKGIRYCLLLAYSIFTNYYLSIMLCIFLALYFVIQVAWKPWSTMWRRSLVFGFYSLLAGGLTGAVLIPAYYAMSTTERMSTAFPTSVKWYMNVWEAIGRHCFRTPWQMSDVHWPSIYCGAAILLFVPLYALNTNISRKEKVSKLALLGILLVSFMNNVLDYFWHGLNYPNSLPARQAYLYIMMLLIIGYEAYIHLESLRLWQLCLAGALSYGVMAYAATKHQVTGADDWSYGITLGIMRIYFAIIFVYCICKTEPVREYLAEKKWFAFITEYKAVPKAIVLLLVVVELSCNMFETSIRTSSRESFQYFYSRQQGAVDWLAKNDTGLYRTEVFSRKTKNDGMIWNVNTATLFASSAESRIRDFYERVGMGAAKGSYWYEGSTALTSAMLGVKYMLGEDNSKANDMYQLVYSDGDGNLYQCKYTLPMGYVVDTDLGELWDTEGLNPIEMQNELGYLLGEDDNLLNYIYSEQTGDYKYEITPAEDSYIYVYLGETDVNKVKVTVDGVSQTYGQVSFDYLINVGYVQAGQTAVVEGVETEKQFTTFEAYSMDLDVLERMLNAMSEESLDITTHKEGYIEGTVSLQNAGELVTALVMDDGWKVTVDGVETETEAFEDMFLAVQLDAGTHHIVLEYKQPGVWTGRLITLACAAILAAVIRIKKKKS